MSTAASTFRSELRAVSWWALVGAAAGAIAGGLIGGVGGRLAMLVLRLTSPDFVIGMESDDGFEIGRFSISTFGLILGMAAAGGVNGVLYAAVRSVIPTRLRLPLWTVFAAAAGGAAVIKEDGVDFTVLEPAALAIAFFVALPAAAAALVVVLVERWIDREPWSDRRLAIVVCAAAVLGTYALGFAAVVCACALLVRRLGAEGLLRAAGRIVVPAGIAVVTVVSTWQLVAKSVRILG